MKKNVVFLLALLIPFELSLIAQSAKMPKIEYSKDSIPILITFNTDNIRKKHSTGISVIKEYLKLSQDDSFKSKKKFTDNLGFLHERFQHYYKGLKVEFSEYNVHSIKDQITSISGTLRRIKSINVNPKFTEKEALSFALKYTNAEKYMWENSEMEQWLKKKKDDITATYYPKGDLVIWTDWNSDTVALSYKFDIYSDKPLNREYVYVDAQDGHIVNAQAIMKSDFPVTANVPTRYCGSQDITVTQVGSMTAKLVDPARNIETKNTQRTEYISNAVDFVNYNEYGIWSSIVWDNYLKDNAALDAQFAAEKTYDYFHQQAFGRDGWDGNNSLLRIYVHFSDMANAFWMPSDDYITLGDGDEYNDDPYTDLDVVAHEFAHGIKDSEIGQNYTGQPGAIEEGLSDIWAACVETYASLPNHNPWEMGDGFESSFHRRNMADPSANPNHYHLNPYQDPLNYPDVYLGQLWYTGSSTSYFTHINSTVLSHWFYLLSEGGSGTNTEQVCFNVSPIGITDAAKIVYYMETALLTQSSTFPDARTFSIESANHLFGENTNQVAQVMNAWHAVGVGNAYTYPLTGPYAVCSSSTTYNINYLPSGTTVTWSKSSNINYVSSTSSSYICTSTEGESGWIEAYITGICTPITSRVNVWIGPPEKPSISPVCDDPYNPFYLDLYGEAYIRIVSSPGSGGFGTWISQGVCQTEACGTYMYAYAPEEGGTVFWVTTENNCGTSPEYFGGIQVGQEEDKSNSNTMSMELSPNPSSTYVDIKLIDNKKDKLIDSYKIELIDSYSRVIKSYKLSGPLNRISTQELSVGYYFVKISIGNTVLRKTLIVKK